MRSVRMWMIAVMLVAMGSFVAVSQPPEGKEKKEGKGGPGGRGGSILPPFVRDELDLTEEQIRKIEDLDRKYHDSMLEILTKQQRQKLEMLTRDMMEKKGGRGGDKGGKGGKGKEGDKGDKGDKGKGGDTGADKGGKGDKAKEGAERPPFEKDEKKKD